MEWRSVRFDWNKARAFLVTAEEGSLSAAARALGLAQPTLSRQVEGFERALGVALFERRGRGLELTDAGHQLLSHAHAMGLAANDLSRVAAGFSDAIEGRVSISASETYAAAFLPKVIAKLRREAPGLEIEVVVSNSASDLRRREADIAVRNFRPSEPDLVAKKVADVGAAFYATPALIKALGHPKTPADLRGAPFVDIDPSGGYLAALNQMGFGLTAENFPLTTESYTVMWELVRQGLGIGVLDALIGDADPHVARVLPDLPLLPFPIWLVAHRDLSSSRRLRLVFDALAEGLSR